MPNEYYYLNHNNPLNHYNKKTSRASVCISPGSFLFITYLISIDWVDHSVQP